MKRIEIIPLALKKTEQRRIPRQWILNVIGGEIMRVEYDPEHDLLNIEFLLGVEIAESVETDGVIFDYAKDRKIVSIEILDASKRVSHSPLDKIDFAVARG